MRIGLLGLPQSGKSTLLAAASTLARPGSGAEREREALTATVGGLRQAVVPIADPRVDWLAQRLRPRKVTYATAEWVELPALAPAHVAELRRVDVVVFVVRAFDPGQRSIPHPRGIVDPAADFEALWQDWLLLDWGVLQNRLERLRTAPSIPKAQRRQVEEEIDLLQRCLAALEAGTSLRRANLREADRSALQGYSLVTFAPALVAVNIDDAEAAAAPSVPTLQVGQRCDAVVRVPARLELELARLDPQTRREFMRELGVEAPLGVERLVAAAHEAAQLISFLTGNEQEVRAWTVRRGTVAREAAGKVHSDIARGFIRAEVIAFEDMQRAGSLARARELGLLRLEGKEYVVRDGDVIEFRFHV